MTIPRARLNSSFLLLAASCSSMLYSFVIILNDLLLEVGLCEGLEKSKPAPLLVYAGCNAEEGLVVGCGAV